MANETDTGTREGVTTRTDYFAAAREVQRQFELVRAREHARVESLRADKVVPHERGEVES